MEDAGVLRLDALPPAERVPTKVARCAKKTLRQNSAALERNVCAVCVHGTLSGRPGDVLESKKRFRKLAADLGL